MNMHIISLENRDASNLVDGVKIRPLKVNQDESGGVLVETLRRDWLDVINDDHPFAMQYFSVTDSLIARDEGVWHYHPTVQDDRFLVVSGEIVVAVADSRDESQTKGLLNLFYMHPTKDPYLLLIPRKTLHGFIVVSKEPAVLLNFPTALYNPSEEGRVPYSDVNIKTQEGQLFTWDLVREIYR